MNFFILRDENKQPAAILSSVVRFSKKEIQDCIDEARNDCIRNEYAGEMLDYVKKHLPKEVIIHSVEDVHFF